MDAALFDQLEQTVKTAGPAAAVDKLAEELKASKDYANLFYALLMKKRVELGVSPIATGSNQDLPASAHQAFEDGIAQAARAVGQLYLDDGQIPQAWGYFRMLGETGPVAAALDKLELDDNADAQAIIDIAFHQGVAPDKGFDWVLQRFGMCSAITVMGGDLPFTPEVRAVCTKKLIVALQQELIDRLRADIQAKQNFAPSGQTVREIIQGRDFLFEDDFYHIDLSHLNSVVQMATQLDKCPELAVTRDLCAYGMKLSPRFRYQSEPPFEDQYADYDKYLAILQGEDVDANLAHFRAKVDANPPDSAGTFPTEIYINLLMRLGRETEALDMVRKYIVPLGDVRLSCPNLVELVQQTKRFDVLAEVGREQGNAVNFLAGLIAGLPSPPGRGGEGERPAKAR
ncbi:MAG: hypothetical protein HYX68_19830 [Planctomycetes bacterium]|nr:hypothetical protein [Planctomycetota bacterium]